MTPVPLLTRPTTAIPSALFIYGPFPPWFSRRAWDLRHVRRGRVAVDRIQEVFELHFAEGGQVLRVDTVQFLEGLLEDLAETFRRLLEVTLKHFEELAFVAFGEIISMNVAVPEGPAAVEKSFGRIHDELDIAIFRVRLTKFEHPLCRPLALRHLEFTRKLMVHKAVIVVQVLLERQATFLELLLFCFLALGHFLFLLLLLEPIAGVKVRVALPFSLAYPTEFVFTLSASLWEENQGTREEEKNGEGNAEEIPSWGRGTSVRGQNE